MQKECFVINLNITINKNFLTDLSVLDNFLVILLLSFVESLELLGENTNS